MSVYTRDVAKFTALLATARQIGGPPRTAHTARGGVAGQSRGGKLAVSYRNTVCVSVVRKKKVVWKMRFFWENMKLERWLKKYIL